jgi:hypothetical protein
MVSIGAVRLVERPKVLRFPRASAERHRWMAEIEAGKAPPRRAGANVANRSVIQITARAFALVIRDKCCLEKIELDRGWRL